MTPEERYELDYLRDELSRAMMIGSADVASLLSVCHIHVERLDRLLDGNKEDINPTEVTIKQECEAAYLQIENAQATLTRLRAICKHTTTHKGNYSWRIGAIDHGDICSDCGTFLGSDGELFGNKIIN